jgi:hypothetical protein
MPTTRAQILTRAHAIPLGVIPYSQAKTNTYTKRRSDCSGWVSYCWGTPTAGPGTYLGAYSTGTFYTQGLIQRLDWADLRPGDAVGYCGPTSPGTGGHITLYLDHEGTAGPGARFHVIDHGSGMGPKDRWVQWDGKSTGWMHPSKIGAWRYVGVVEDDGASYSPVSNLEETDVEIAKFIQQALHDAGYDIGTSGPNKDGVDGDLGAKSLAAMTAALRQPEAAPAQPLTKAAILAALA